MSFDWQQESKERYFRMAEEKIEAAGFGDFLHIDRTAFGTVAGKTVKVYMERFTGLAMRGGGSRREKCFRNSRNAHHLATPTERKKNRFFCTDILK